MTGEVAAVVEGILSGRALVFGSLPPLGRDLDLLVRPAEQPGLEAALTREGFRRHGRIWARFHDCRVDVVEVMPVERWGLPDDEIDALFSDALPLEGHQHLVRPAPPHVLLIQARRAAASGELDGKRRARVAAAVTEDPSAWAAAARRAATWRAEDALAALRDAFEEGRPIPPDVARRQAPKDRLRSLFPRRPAVVTLSGLDGSGKSTQAEALRDALQRLGYDATVAWTRLAYDATLESLARRVKKVLIREHPGGTTRDPARERDERAHQIRARYRIVNQVWTFIVALTNALNHRSPPGGAASARRVVIRDRYVLDSAVNLRFRYGVGDRFRLQARLVRLLSPRPVASFFLDVPAAVAHERKPEKYSEQDLEHMRRLYLEENRWVVVERLDGTRPRAELCGEVASRVWEVLEVDRSRFRSWAGAWLRAREGRT